jgi:hypothetical protein
LWKGQRLEGDIQRVCDGFIKAALTRWTPEYHGFRFKAGKGSYKSFRTSASLVDVA